MQEFNNYIGTFFVCGTIFVIVLTAFVIYLLSVHRKHRNRYYLDREDMILKHHAHEIKVRVEENERTITQISKEVHDNIGQIANMIMMHLGHFETLLTEEKQRIFLGRVTSLAEKLIRDAKNISHSLSGEYIKEWGLYNIIHDDLEHLEIAKKISCEIDVTGVNSFLDDDDQLIIYRIAQEAINNILKYSRATFVTVTLAFGDDTFTMSIQDDGVGFDYEKALVGVGTGIINMTARAEFLNAELNIRTAPGEGCGLILIIPNTLSGNSQ